jgi:YVTN family beta-propeller protein
MMAAIVGNSPEVWGNSTLVEIPPSFGLASLKIAPTTTTYYCANAAGGPISGVAVVYVVSSPVTATVTPASPSIDSGQSITLTANPSLGVAPYTYQWYAGGSCSESGGVWSATGGAEESGATSASYNTGALSTGATYNVIVTDSSAGLPTSALPDTYCASAIVKVETPLFSINTVSISGPTAIDLGYPQSIPISVGWNGGTSPYTVTLLSGSSSSCASDTTVIGTQTGATSPASFSVSAPTSVGLYYYCATVLDSAYAPQTASMVTTTASLKVNSPPGTPVIQLTANGHPISNIDVGQTIPTPFGVLVTWTDGNPSYTVTIMSGSSSTCASDTTVVTGPLAETSGSTIGLPNPPSNIFYCAVVKDNGGTGIPIMSPTVSFNYVPLPLVTLALKPTATDSGVGTVTATFTLSSGGVSPYTVAFYQTTGAPANPTSCGAGPTLVSLLQNGYNPLTTFTGKSGTFTFNTPNAAGPTYYCVVVTDSSATAATVIASGSITINAALAITSFLANPAPLTIDQGQTEPITVTVDWGTSGTGPFTVTITSGPFVGCSGDTNVVTSKANAVAPQTITFKSSTSATVANPTYYCATVTDSLGGTGTSPVSIPFTVSTPLSAQVSGPLTVVPAGTTQTLTATVGAAATPLNIGTPGYYFTWYTGSACSKTSIASGPNAVAMSSPATFKPLVTTTTTYSVNVTDSSAVTAQVCLQVTVTVGDGPTVVASNAATDMMYVSNPYSKSITVIDTIGNAKVATIFIGYSVTGIAVDSGNNVIYVSGGTTITAIDGATNSIIASATTSIAGASLEGIAFNPLTSILYVADSANNCVYAIPITYSGHTPSLGTPQTIPVGYDPQNIAIGPFTGAYYNVFVTDYGQNAVSVIDVTPSCVSTPSCTYEVTNVPVGANPWGVAVNPSTDRVYVVNSGAGTLTVLNGTTFATIGSLMVGVNPLTVTIDSATSTAYVAGGVGSSTVTVVSLSGKAPSVTAYIPVGPGPYGIAFISNQAYVTNSLSNTISVIDLANNQLITTLVVGP